jgi:CheY-like chemotaxis protein
MTAHALKGDRERCLAAGMDGYVSKPIHSRELFEVIEGLFAVPAEAVTGPIPQTADREIIDWQEALQAVQRKPHILRSVVEAELSEIPCLMEAIRRGVADGNKKALQLATHTLKGSLRYFGKTTAFQAVLRLEEMAREGDLTQAGDTLALLERAIRRMIEAFREYLQGTPSNPAADCGSEK